MKIAFLAGQSSIHTVKWVNEMAKRGHEVSLITMHPGTEEINKNVIVYKLPFKPPLGYYFNLWNFKKLLKKIKPDILNTHYASGYGTLARLAGFHPYVLSVWGSDVYDYPLKSFIHRKIVIKNLINADWICSTSNVMLKQVQSLYPNLKNFTVVPFGVDTKLFRPCLGLKDQSFVTVGTVKTLAPKYGVDLLVKAFGRVREELRGRSPELFQKLRLLIVGGGPQQVEIERLANQLGLNEITQFVGRVPHAEVPKFLNLLDIYVAASRMESESFGVAVVEASACGIPVIVSNVGGLPKVVKGGETGLIVERENVDALSKAMLKLIEDPLLRERMGKAGRQYILNNFNWDDNATLMEKVYVEVLRKKD